LSFGNVVDWHAGVCFTLEVTEYFILYTPALWPACVKPGACHVHLPCFYALIENLMLDTNNLLHVNKILTQYTIHIIFTCNTNNTTTQARVQVAEADWLTGT
jgi:hypothetical protein